MNEMCESPMAMKQAQPPALLDILRTRRENLERELAVIKEAEEGLRAHPELAELLNKISKCNVRY